MTPLVSVGSNAHNCAAAPATIAAELDVPLIVLYEFARSVVRMLVPGAARNTDGP
jgi:hypothetical protein